MLSPLAHKKQKKQNITSIKHSGFLLARRCHARDRNILLCHALSFSPPASASLILSYWKRRLLCHSPSTPPPPPPPPAPSTHSFPHPLPLLPLLLLLLLHTGEITCSSVPAGAARGDSARPFVCLSPVVLHSCTASERRTTAPCSEGCPAINPPSINTQPEYMQWRIKEIQEGQ